MTPSALWRPALPPGAFIVGPATCQTCHRPVWFGRSTTRVEGQTVIGETRVWRDWGAYRTHRCEPKPLTKSALRSRGCRARARATTYNSASGRSAEPNSMAPDARLSATTREAGVVGAIEVVAR